MNEDCLTLLIGIPGAGKSHWEGTRPAELPSRAIEVSRLTRNRILHRGRADGDTAVDDALRDPAGKVIETRFTHKKWRSVVFSAALAAQVPVVACLVHTENQIAIQRRLSRARRKEQGTQAKYRRKTGPELMQCVIAHALDLTALTCVDNESQPKVIARIDRRRARRSQLTGRGTWAEKVTVPVLDAWLEEEVRRPAVNRIHRLADIDRTARLGTRIQAGRHAEVGRYCRIGPRSTLEAHAMVRERSTLGTATTVRRHAQLGRECTTGKGAVLGESANVREGCTIGAFTRIGEHTIVDKGTRIGANVRVGKHCLIGAGCTIGDGAVIADGSHLPAGTTAEADSGHPTADAVTVGHSDDGTRQRNSVEGRTDHDADADAVRPLTDTRQP